MSRKTIYIISSIVIIGFLLIAGISVWLLGTVQGAAWTIRTIAHQAGAEIEFGIIEGRLWNAVSLEGIEATWHQGHAKADKLFFEWHPLMAITGNIAVKRLSVNNVVMQDDRPEEDKPPDLSWPKVNGVPAKLDAWIDTLEITGLDYTRLKNTPFTVRNASALVIWHNSMISFRNLMLSTPGIGVTGTVEAGFLHPSLLADITASPAQPLQDIARFSLKARLMPGHGAEQLHGPVTISGLSGDEQLVTISFLTGITKTALNLSELRAEQASRKGMLNGKGAIDFSEISPALNFSLGVESLDLSPETGTATNIHGSLTLNGSLEDYRGDFSFSNKGPQTHQAEITGSLNGSKHDLNIQITRGAFLGGKLKGKIDTSWREGITLESELQARNMDPAILSPDWSGTVNLNLSVGVTKPEDGETTGIIRGRILESRLRGTDLTGELHAEMHGEDLIIRKLALKGNGFDINAHGDLAKRLSFLARINDLSGLVPDVRGRLNTEGWVSKNRDGIAVSLNAQATLALDGHPISLKNISLNLDTKGRKILSRLDIELTSGGSIHGQFSSPMPPQRALPEQGDISVELNHVDLAFIQSWLPEGFSIKGSIAGQVKGNLFPDGKFALSGSTSLSQGSFIRETTKGRLSAGLRNTAASWNWSGDVLKGDATVTLAEHGKASVHFELPVPARIPLAVNQTGAMRIAIDADVQEKGMLTSIFPGLVQESHGGLELSSRIGGTWKDPQFKGTVLLKDAGAYFPATGIRLKDVLFRGRFESDRLIIDTFSAKSGDGSIEGTARISLKNWAVSHYEGNISGKRFRTVHIPELQVETSPQLKFEGSPEKLSVKGEITIPELFVYDSGSSAPVKPSSDVIIVDASEQMKKGPLLALDIQIHLILGKKVFVKAEGIDAQLKGDVVLTAKNPDEINGKGLIQVVKGDYRRYGVNLNITRGRLIFNGLVTRPNLDVVALRTTGDVKTGVTVSGTPQSPEVKLYSEPPMPDTDILAYMVFGHPLGSNKEQSSAVLQAAGVLLSQGESVALQEKMKQSLGVDVLDVESGGGDLSRSMLTVGKYLTPRLFISYGQSLFDEGGLFRLRYSLSRRWEIETQSGEQTGGDLFYKIEFR
ncbi:MAG: translocation/assembly module TamB domain-containing protein [Thermodesulfovibrionales bacterium]|nr:translocation/assembly module TamB domain-containing protein [Thermodesulfovibrionales bacterium]